MGTAKIDGSRVEQVIVSTVTIWIKVDVVIPRHIEYTFIAPDNAAFNPKGGDVPLVVEG